MKRRPLFALACSLLVSSAAIEAFSLSITELWLAALMLIIVLFSWLFTTRTLPGTLWVGGFLALIVCLDQSPKPLHSVENSTTRARVEGRVIRTMGANAQSYLLEGSVDARGAPSVRCTTMLRVIDEQTAPCQLGDVIVAVGTVEGYRQGSTPGEFPVRAWHYSQGIALCVRSVAEDVHVVESHTLGWQQNLRDGFSNHVRSQFTNYLHPTNAGLLTAMITGNRSWVPTNVTENMRHTGTAHLMAVSGSHMAMVLLVIVVFVGTPTRSTLKLIAVIVLLCLYVCATGASAPTIRAAIMAMAFWVGRRRQFDVDPLNVLGLSILIELIIWPQDLRSVSFQLSTIATIGILLFVPAYRRWFDLFTGDGLLRQAKPLVSPLSISFAASTAVAIPSALHFGTMSVLSPLTNLVVVPVMLVCMGLGVLLTALSFVSHELASALGWSLDVLMDFALGVISMAGDYEPTLPESTVAIAAVLLVATWVWILTSERVRDACSRVAISATVLSLLLLWTEPWEGHNGVFLSAGRADITVVADLGSKRRHAAFYSRYGNVFVRLRHDNTTTAE